MDENLLSQNQSQEGSLEAQEPETYSENSYQETSNTPQETAFNDGQSLDPLTEELILGKFKSVDDLSKAYQELEKRQGLQSDELGNLRKRCVNYDAMDETFKGMKLLLGPYGQVLRDARSKYDTPNYFQNPSFEEMFKEAFFALGDKLDPDKFVHLLESYVSSRIFAHEQSRAAGKETQDIINSMGYSKNPNSSINPPKKKLDEMTQKEIDDLLDRLI